LLRTAARVRLLPQLARRARHVREPFAFARAEIDPRPSLRAYTLRRTGMVCHLRHHANDLGAFDDIVLADEYAPPPPVMRWLAARDHGPRILDLGGHVGLFCLDMLARLPAATLTTLEPDPANLAVLRRTIERNGLSAAVEVIGCAAAPRTGPVAFMSGYGVASYEAAGEEAGGAVTVPGIDVLDLMAAADLVKMDIEGGEWAILADPRAVAAAGPVIVLEFHDRLCPFDDAEAAVMAWLERAGLHVWPDVRRLPGMGLIWAFDPALLAAPTARA
jgi:FkbM family methyltransferase